MIVTSLDMNILKIHSYVKIAFLTCIIPTLATSENNFCSEQHFCSCPPFLRYSSPNQESEIHFTKHNYDDQYAILGKSKELHCCVGPDYHQLEWFKDGDEFPWNKNVGKSRNAILYSTNQSLIIMEVRSEDSGKYTCVAKSKSGQFLRHTTRLQSFPPPVFAHPPIWNHMPSNIKTTRGGNVKLDCSVTVGQQYNTVSMQPVYAAWLRFGREMEDGERIHVVQQWSDDDIVIHLRLEITEVDNSDAGEYSCKVKNEYGVLEKKVTLAVEDLTPTEDELAVKKELASIFKKQIKIYSLLSRFSSKHHQSVQEMLKSAEAIWN